MSADERILRLENAFAALSELAARSQEVDARREARLNTLAESNRLIVELIRRHDERMDEFRATQAEFDEARRAVEDELRALRAATEHKLAALVDAQIRGEVSMEKLRVAQLRSEESTEVLRAAQAEAAHKITEMAAALERLSQTVETALRSGRGGQPLG
jgi:uncharacterized protein YukE